MYHRPAPVVRHPSSGSPASSPRPKPLAHLDKSPDSPPTIFGLPLKYVSLVTLAVQNAALSIVMHYSRVSTPPELSYSPASAVLLNELLKGSISFIIALARQSPMNEIPWSSLSPLEVFVNLPWPWTQPFFNLCAEILSPDAWKLSIPAILYVIQNSLQFVAISNLPVASFQVTYQMKILTTAAFSVAMLRKRISSTKWLSLFFLAIGVAIVQIQTAGDAGATHKEQVVGSAHDSAPLHIHVMSPLKGFGAVTAACFTSGLAGVYFEMVLKNSKADLWVRNVQLSLFSLIPALLPIIYSPTPTNSQGFLHDLFRHFGFWAWCTVAIQVFGGLITAVVIKYSDNILKGFATSLSIILSFLASVVLFNFRITSSFLLGASTVLVATWMYNQPDQKNPPLTGASTHAPTTKRSMASLVGFGDEKKANAFPGSPIGPDAPILGELPPIGGRSKKSSSSLSDGLRNAIGRLTPNSSTDSLASTFQHHTIPPPHSNNSSPPSQHLYPRYSTAAASSTLVSTSQHLHPHHPHHPHHHPQQQQQQTGLGGTVDTPRYLNAPYGSPYPSRPPSRASSRSSTEDSATRR